MKIKDIVSRQILDSRGNPTIETDVILDNGVLGRAAVPSGKSTGRHEAVELRDHTKKWHGKGVAKAIRNVEKIKKILVGMDVRKQHDIDLKMVEFDGTKNKSRLGANAILSVSLASSRAAAFSLGLNLFEYIWELWDSVNLCLPVPMMNIINGGEHAGSNLSIQEFMIIPFGKTFSESLRMGSEIYHTLKEVLKKKYGRQAVNVGDEGGFAPPMKRTRDALDALIKAINKSGYVPGKNVYLGMDAAASEFFSKGKYEIDGKKLTREKLLDFYENLVSDYPILSIEDPFNEDDFEGFSLITKSLGDKVFIVGDDLFVTNFSRLGEGISMGAANTLLLKVNQIGTLTEAINTAHLAVENGYKVVVSHRSGETEDPYIAHLSVGIGAHFIKTGAPCRGERTAKYNELIRIEEVLGDKADYWGRWILRRNALKF